MWSEVDKVCIIWDLSTLYFIFSLKAELANSSRPAGQVARGILFPVYQHWDYRYEAQLDIYTDTDIYYQALVGSILLTVVV